MASAAPPHTVDGWEGLTPVCDGAGGAALKGRAKYQIVFAI